MTQYRRASVPGARWFFTVNLAERDGNRLLVDEIGTLRAAIRAVQAVHSFRIDAAVILPDHLHCIWTLPLADSDFSTRWGLIKGNFSRSIHKGEERGTTVTKPDKKRRTRIVATAFLGTSHSGRRGFEAPHGLHSM